MNLFQWTYEIRFIVALALGFLIGLERERSGSERKNRLFAGVRTYTLISLFGFACGWLFHINVTFALPAGMLSIAALALMGYISKLKEGKTGTTSEVAALLTFTIGALSMLADIWLPMALGIIATFLLSEKAELESWVERLDKTEFLAVIKFLLITLIILPALPDQNYTQFNLNPKNIWEYVIMVSTIGFVGYFLMKKFGGKVGLWLSGLLGGIVSSTAVSIAVGRIAKNNPEQSGNALQASLLASSVMYIRILIIIGIINPSSIFLLWWKFALLTIIGIALSFGLKSKKSQPGAHSVSTLQNPFEIKPAIFFAALFVILSVVTILVKNYFGNGGLLTLSAVVGVTDIDPFILSLIQGAKPLEPIIISAIIMAMMSNTIIKAIYFAVQAKDIRKETYIRYGIWAVLHLPFIIFL
ncbi:MAG: MgtC/SapB family protein [Ignavibacteriaceae bacterium]